VLIQEAAMSRTLAEIVIAIIVVVIFFRLGVEIAPIIMDWWRDLRNAANGDERNDNDDK
jgi:hypothetical protein